MNTLMHNSLFSSWRILRRILLRITHALVIISVVASSFTIVAEGASVHTPLDDPDQAIQEIADEPLANTPLRYRNSAYEILIPYTAAASDSKPEKDELPVDMVDQITINNDLYFIDEGRISSVIVLDYDWDLIKHLVKLLRDKNVDQSAKSKYLDGLLDIVRADKHIAALAIYDISTIIQGCEVLSGQNKSDCNKSQAHLNTAEIRYENGLDALRQGDADGAVHHFNKSWVFSNKVFELWDLTFEGDLDGDGLINILEFRVGSSIFSSDTDQDGLSDQYEFFFLLPHALPTNADTDGNGILDSQEDFDEDGLSNSLEQQLGTNPLLKDTDGDGVDDLYEVNNPDFNPLMADSDFDELPDDSELRLGTSPSNPDSDGDGIPDNEDQHYQVMHDQDLGLTVELVGVGDHSKTLQTHDLAGVSGFVSVPGLIGNFISFSTDLPFSTAYVRVRFDPTLVPDADYSNLRLLSYDHESASLVMLTGQEVDTNAWEVKAEISHFWPVGVVHAPTWLSTASVDHETNLSLVVNHTKPAGNLGKGARGVPARFLPALSLETQLTDGVTALESTPEPPLPPETTIEASPASEITADPSATPDPLIEPTPTPEMTPESDSESVNTPETEGPIPIPTLNIPLVTLSTMSRQQENFASEAGANNFIIGGGSINQHSPAVAFNQNLQEYLVAWVSETEPAAIYGRLLTAQGQLLGDAFLLVQETVDTPSRLELQYNSTDETYLLAWQELNGETSVESYYYGQIVYSIPRANLYTLLINPDGTPLTSAPNLVTDELTDFDGRHEYDLTYNSSTNQYLVAWVQPRGAIIARVVHPHRLMIQELDTQGAPQGNPAILRIGVASDVRVDHSPINNNYFVTYSFFYPGAVEYEVGAHLVDGASLVSIGSLNPTNFRTGWQFLPQITYNSSNDMFFCAWLDSPEHPSGFGHLRGQFVRADTGTQPSGNFLILESLDQGVFFEMPGLGYSQIEDRYLALGALGGAPDLRGQYVLQDRTLDGESFPIDTSAIQNAVVPRIGGESQAPAWLTVWTSDGDIYGQLLPDVMVGDVDTDLDGLTDAQETAGFLNQFGQRITTDPLKADSDADGIPDGDEVGLESNGAYHMISDPTLADTDSDGVEDFVELYALPEPTLPRDPDTDGDGLADGEEVNDYSTDPWSKDTDGDDVRDGDEINNGSDPLIAKQKFDAGETAWQFTVGAVCGDFCLDNPDYGTVPFLIGLLISGAISVLPFGITQAVGLVADARDFFAAINNKDLVSLGILSLTLVPYIGDPSDVVGTIGRFVGKYPRFASEVAVILVRMDWLWRTLADADQITVLRKIWSDEIIDALLNKGFDFARVVDLTNAGVDLRHLASALDEIAEQFPGLISFLKKVPLDGEGVLRGNGLTANLKGLANAKKLGNARSLSTYLGNIKGAYTQAVMKADRISEGFEIVQDLRHVNAAGYDLVLKKGGVTRILEAKSGARLTLKEITNYIGKVGDERLFDTQYLVKWLGEDTANALLETGKFEIEFFINNPQSGKIANELLDLLGGNTAKYLDEDGIPHIIEVIITHVNK
jgi:hypothetical protein